MENFVVSARKYRPDRFKTVVGQPSITRTLQNAVNSNQLAHAYLFCGPRGVGKTTCARIFAKTINCAHPDSEGEACGTCESCLSFTQNRSFSIHELDAASNNSVDDIRSLIDQIRVPPQVGKYSVYIIDEVHMLSQQAFNAFLKTLEEPPAHAIFILATTEKHKIIPTILSRCQIFDFNRISVSEMTAQLRAVAENEKVDCEDAALNVIAQKAEGSMRDALSIFDQVVSFGGKTLTYQIVVSNLNVLDYEYYFKLTDAFMAGAYQNVLIIYNEILSKGFDSHNFINGLSSHFRDLLVSRDQETVELMEYSGEIAQRYLTVARQSELSFLYNSLQILNQCDVQFKQAKDSRLHVEVCLLKLCAAGRTSGNPLLNSISNNDSQEKVLEKKTAPATAENTPKDLPPTKEKDTDEEKKADLQDNSLKISTPDVGIKTTPKLSDYLNKASIITIPELSEQKIAEKSDEVVLDLSEESVRIVWKDFAEKFRSEQPRMYNMLVSQDPVLDQQRVVVTLNNPLQVKALNSIHSELEGYLRIRTGSADIRLEKVLDQASGTERKLFTQDEKYKHLSNQNPVLDNFRQNLKLDFE